MLVTHSVVIPTHNRSRALRECVVSVLTQTVPEDTYEVIVVDDGSTDATSAVVAELRKQYPNRIVYLHEEKNRGCAYARNRGVQEARGSLIFFTDDDCVVPPNWIEKHVATHARYPHACGVGGWYWPKDENAVDYFNQFYKALFEYSYPGMQNHEVETNTMYSPAGNTANVSYKRVIVNREGWFDESLHFTGGVDWELKTRLTLRGHAFVSIPLHVTHSKTFNLWTFIGKSIRQGRGMDYRLKKFVRAPHVELPYFLSVRNVLSQYGRWSSRLNGNMTYHAVYALWLISCLCGKYINRLLFFSPSAREFGPTTIIRYSRRYVEGALFSEERFEPEPVVSHVQLASPTPFLSVIIPTYNRASLLAHTLESVLIQSLPANAYEIVIVDDGSTDDTGACVASLAEKYPGRIRYVFQSNKGPAVARNTGAREARGDIIVFLDSDCLVPSTWLESHKKYYLSDPSVIGVGGGQRTPPHRTSLFDIYRNNFPLNRYGLVWPQWCLKTNDISLRIVPYDTANISYRKSIFLKLGGFDEGFPTAAHEDVEFASRVQRAGYQMVVIPLYVQSMRSMNFQMFVQMATTRAQSQKILREKVVPPPRDLSTLPTRTLCICLLIRWLLWPFSKTDLAALLYALIQHQSIRTNAPETLK